MRGPAAPRPSAPDSVAAVNGIPDHAGRIAAALRGAIAAQPQRDAVGAAHDMLADAECLQGPGALDLDELRQRHLDERGGPALLVRVLPIGLASPFDRPRVRRDAYRCAAASGADEGTAIVAVAAALVAADLLRFDPATTAIRVRQTLLEDAPWPCSTASRCSLRTARSTTSATTRVRLCRWR